MAACLSTAPRKRPSSAREFAGARRSSGRSLLLAARGVAVRLSHRVACALALEGANPVRRIHKCWPGVPSVSSVLACISPRPVQNLHTVGLQTPRITRFWCRASPEVRVASGFATQSWLVWVRGCVVERRATLGREVLDRPNHPCVECVTPGEPAGCCRRGPSGIVQTPAVQKARR